jgi:ABC-type branched-subunit amino acid transport system ATPase component
VPTVLENKALHAGYGGGEVLRGFSLGVARGEIVALLGRNGMGKTTLLRCIMGLLPPTAGSISFDGQSLSGLDCFEIARRGIAYVPQGREIFGQLSVEENLRLAALRGGTIEAGYDLFPGLRARAGDPGGSLSGGQQQQLAIARAMVSRPRLLLLDEPSEGIQPSVVREIADIVAGSARSMDLSVLLVEQNTDLALRVADRAVFVDHGVDAASVASRDVTPGILASFMEL